VSRVLNGTRGTKPKTRDRDVCSKILAVSSPTATVAGNDLSALA
jgi:hypothetical protein